MHGRSEVDPSNDVTRGLIGKSTLIGFPDFVLSLLYAWVCSAINPCPWVNNMKWTLTNRSENHVLAFL